MKLSTSTGRFVIAALTVFTLAASTPASSAGNGSDARNADQVPTPTSPAIPSHEHKGHLASSLVLLVDAPTGGTVRLTYIQDTGWSFVQAAGDGASQPRMTSTAAGQHAQGPLPNEPLTVFIDGPTGFTYVWIRDVGWKFIGRIAGARP